MYETEKEGEYLPFDKKHDLDACPDGTACTPVGTNDFEGMDP